MVIAIIYSISYFEQKFNMIKKSMKLLVLHLSIKTNVIYLRKLTLFTVFYEH